MLPKTFWFDVNIIIEIDRLHSHSIGDRNESRIMIDND